ncbi:MAG TPA: helix-turn-helix transcriptional regulator [Sphingopyxis sp.]|nr:helix-turn-helix transcriptional regulator [Sphingopyxis sp.]
METRAIAEVSNFLTLCQREAKRLNLSERQIGVRAKMHHTSVSNYLVEKRVPKASHLLRLSTALDIDPTRAFLAIFVFKSLDAYDAPTTKLLASLIPDLAAAIDNCDLEDELRDWETESLLQKLRELLVDLIGPRWKIRQMFFRSRTG